MNIYVLLSIIFAIIAILLLLYFTSYFKLKEYKERMDKAENIIDTNLNKKLDLIISINNEIKKCTNKKDYLKEYTAIKDLIITNIEKDWRLDEAIKLINDLALDYKKLNDSKKFKELILEIKKTDEIITSAKNMFNSNALESNKTIKLFPNNIVAKISNFKKRSFYNNKLDDNESF